MLVVEEPDGKRHEIFVIDYHTHIWRGDRNNWLRPDLAKGWIDCFYDYHRSLSPKEYVWDYETFLYYGAERFIRDVFVDAGVDMAISQPAYLQYFFREPFGNTEEFGKMALLYPERFIIGTRWDPREGEEGKRQLENDVRRFRVRPWQMRHVKLYTAEWKAIGGSLSRGWRLDTKEAFEYLEYNKELGIDIQVPHKGPTVWPLDKDSFDVHDVDAAATSFPELRFLVTHIGLPRYDDFAWIAKQDKNIYAGLAVATAFIKSRPRYFAEIIANLLYWLGPDRIIFGSDYALWHPKWIIDGLIRFELPKDIESEYGVELSMEIKKKILGENAARLWGIDINEVKKIHERDNISTKYSAKPRYIKIAEK
jgi:predicted TIM-barrel fold metal-dependent hydrolase